MSRSEYKLSESPCEIQNLEFVEDLFIGEWYGDYWYYFGSIKNGKPHGVGRVIFYHESSAYGILEGQFKEGKLNGYVRTIEDKFTYRTSQHKEGQFMCYRFHYDLT